MTRVTIPEEILRWALERAGNPAAVHNKFPQLDAWLQGEKQPTLRQLEQFARATATPLGYLFLAQPVEGQLPIPHFRTLGRDASRRPSTALIETVHTMERRQSWLRQHLIEQGHDPLPFVHSASLNTPPEQVAQAIRQTLNMPEEWAASQPTWEKALQEWIARIEQAGIMVSVNSIVGNNTHRQLDPAEFRGFVLVDPYAPLVFINGADSKAAQMFTLAHELAHIWFGRSAAFDLRNLQPARDQTEEACNRVAAEFLVPATRLREVWAWATAKPEPFQSVARHFKVSVLVAARRVLDLGLIAPEQFRAFYTAYMERERTSNQDGGGGDFYKTQKRRLSRRFGEAVVRAVREGKLLYREAYQLTGLHGETFEQFARQFNGWGEEA